MRRSSPMPRATSCTSAPTVSQRSAISLMKVILVARNALAAYLISSAARAAGEQDRRLVDEQRPIDLAHDGARAFVVGADHDAVGMPEIFDRRAFAQEFRIGDDVEVGVGPRLADDLLDFVVGPDRYGRFGRDDGKALDLGRDLAAAAYTKDRSAKPSPRRHGVPTAMNTASAARTASPASVANEGGRPPHCAATASSSPGSKIGSSPLRKPRDLRAVLVDADDIVAEIGKAGAGDEPHIAGADHCYPHDESLPLRAPGMSAIVLDEPGIISRPMAGLNRRARPAPPAARR